MGDGTEIPWDLSPWIGTGTHFRGTVGTGTDFRGTVPAGCLDWDFNFFLFFLCALN